MSAQPPFRIGLCLAGAVSTGAYTAGVLDYLMEALHAWEQRKQNNTPNTPTHQVEIPMLAGASAGGMTGLILAAGVNQTWHPVNYFPTAHQEIKQNLLYHAWVDQLSPAMFPLLLKPNDIKKENIPSLLNSDFIDVIANRVLQQNQSPAVYPPFMAKHLKVMATLTNLKGFPYNVALNSQVTQSQYLMSQHHDYACFVLNKASHEYNNDGWIPLNFFQSTNLPLAREAAMATGAFPLGLKARTVTRNALHIHQNPWLRELFAQKPAPNPSDLITHVQVDGGVINNEPFEKVQEELNRITGEQNEAQKSYNTFKSTVLLVDPFPSEEATFNPALDIANIAGNTLNAMLAHMRAKRKVLESAWQSDNAGLYLIAPSRPNHRAGGPRLDGAQAIACGSLRGFGGFLHKHFRMHDFFLGRANCERFLRHHFTVPANTQNPIFTAGYQNINTQPFTSPTDDGLQIIPLFTPEQPHIPLPNFNGSNWPRITKDELDAFDKPLRKRIHAIIMNWDNYRWDTRLLIGIGARVILNRKIANTVVKIMKKEMREHNLLH